jgi:hypothetical protein
MLYFALTAFCLQGIALSGECYKCEEIKEKNKNLPPLKYEFYDDYLEAMRAEGKPLPGDIEITGEDGKAEKKEE